MLVICRTLNCYILQVSLCIIHGLLHKFSYYLIYVLIHYSFIKYIYIYIYIYILYIYIL